MDRSSAQHHHQEMGSQTLESMLVCTKAQEEKKPRPAEQALKCPRCDSTNTKFCYYNNYSLTQPRYFCKSCRRYWTKGGTLRNVPVGGGCRKNKRSSSSSSKRSSQDQPLTNNSIPHPLSSLNPLSYDSGEYTSTGLARGSELLDLGRDSLSLAIARLQKQASGKLGFEDTHEFQPLGGGQNHHHHLNFDGLGNPNNVHFDALRNGFLETPNGVHNFYYGNVGHVENGGGGGGGLGMSVSEEMTMPFEELNATTATTTTPTIVKQEMCNGRSGNENNRVLWGFPWQINNGGDHVSMADLDSGRQSWNAFGSTTWHGLLNGPLM